jgi:hypothetical protein
MSFIEALSKYEEANECLQRAHLSLSNIMGSFPKECLNDDMFIVKEQYIERGNRMYEKFLKLDLMNQIFYQLVDAWYKEGCEDSKLGEHACEHLYLFVRGVNRLSDNLNRLNETRLSQTLEYDRVVVDLTVSSHDMYVFVKFTIF